jgi:hypothetical protein
MTKEQTTVVNARLRDGYTLLGYAGSRVVAGPVAVLSKGRHTMAINALGYDEHIPGRTYRLGDAP